MNDLTEFLLARIAEEEGAAHEIPPGVFEDACSISRSYEFVFRHAPSRVLAECEANRRIVAEHRLEPVRPADHLIPWPTGGGCGMCEHDCNTGGDPTGDGPCPTLRALALPHADHPDYRDEWRP